MVRKLYLILLLSGFILILSGNITRIEYFFDTDPGFGNGTALPFTGNPEATVSADISASQLSGGLHYLNIRAKDTDGKWSLIGFKPFFKTGSATSDITRLEYYFDADPGYGNGYPVSISPSSQITYIDDINLSALSNGLHYLYFRAKNSEDFWSMNAYRMILKIPTAIPALTTFTYFFDGNSANAESINAVPLNGDVTASEMAFIIDPADFNLLGGLHLLNLQADNASGFQSHIINRLVYYMPDEQPDLTKAEWYFTGSDADPGQIFSCALTAPSADITAQIAPTLTHLTQDSEYQMHFYMVNAMGQKSLEQVLPFTCNFTPLNLVITINGMDMTLSWDEIPGSEHYNVLVKATPAGTGTSHAVIGNSYTAPTQIAQFYEVTAVSADRGNTHIAAQQKDSR